jgi:hypothetical protein
MSNEVTNQPTPQEHYVGEPPPPPPRMSYLDKVVGILTEPRAFFTNLRAHPEWLTPYLTIGIVTAILTAFAVPRAIQMSHVAMDASARGQQIPEFAYKISDGFAYASPVLVFAGILFVWLVATAILFLVSLIAGASPDFNLLWTVVAWSGFPSLFEQIIKTVYVLAAPPPTTMDEINSLKVFSISLGQLMPAGSLAFKLAQPVNLFAIWSIILLYEGLVHLLKMNRRLAGTIVIVYAIVGYAIQLALVMLALSQGGGQSVSVRAG